MLASWIMGMTSRMKLRRSWTMVSRMMAAGILDDGRMKIGSCEVLLGLCVVFALGCDGR